MDWKVGNWVVYDRSIGQIKELREDGMASFSDGSFETSGRLTDRFRPLTLRNKRIAETFEIYYGRLGEVDGEAGFNYPDISRYFSQLALDAIDREDNADLFTKAQEFVREARDHASVIQGVRLFRPQLRRASQ